MSIDIRQMRCFIAVAEELHFRRAAERIGIAQPALSRTVQNLEKELGVTLFDRSNRSVEMTKAGHTFLRGCHRVISGLEQTVDETRRVHLGKMGLLRIGYTDTAITGCVPDLLKRFQDCQPDIDLQLHHAVTSTQLGSLDGGDLDFGFVTGVINRAGFESHPVQSEGFVCVVYDRHPFANRASVRLEELADEDMVHGTSTDWEYFFSYLIPVCRRAGFEPKIVQEGLTTAAILGLVACGMGITILTDSVRGAIGQGVRIVPLENVTERLNTVAAWKTDTTNGAKEHFVEFLRRWPAG